MSQGVPPPPSPVSCRCEPVTDVTGVAIRFLRRAAPTCAAAASLVFCRGRRLLSLRQPISKPLSGSRKSGHFLFCGSLHLPQAALRRKTRRPAVSSVSVRAPFAPAVSLRRGDPRGRPQAFLPFTPLTLFSLSLAVLISRY